MDYSISSIEFIKDDYLTIKGRVYYNGRSAIISDTTNQFTIDVFWSGLYQSIKNQLDILFSCCENSLNNMHALYSEGVIQSKIRKIVVYNPDINIRDWPDTVSVKYYSDRLSFNQDETKFIFQADDYIDTKVLFSTINTKMIE